MYDPITPSHACMHACNAVYVESYVRTYVRILNDAHEISSDPLHSFFITHNGGDGHTESVTVAAAAAPLHRRAQHVGPVIFEHSQHSRHRPPRPRRRHADPEERGVGRRLRGDRDRRRRRRVGSRPSVPRRRRRRRRFSDGGRRLARVEGRDRRFEAFDVRYRLVDDPRPRRLHCMR